MRNWGKYIGWLWLGVLTFSVQAQTLPSDSSAIGAPVRTDSAQFLSDFITIDRIFVLGNRITKQSIIERELSISEGLTFPAYELNKLLKEDRKKLMNTRLFLDVDLHVVEIQPGQADVIIRVAERWYTVPTPYLALPAAVRNINVFLDDPDWNLLTYGIKFTQFNFRGRNERLAAIAQFGFTREFSIEYSIPYVDAAQKNGIEVGFSYSENRNTNYMTRDHRFQFSNNVLDAPLNPALREVIASLGWSYRPSYYNTHGITLSYSDALVADTVLGLNPDYFTHGDNRQQYFMLNYTARGDYRDFIGYPLKGYQWRTSVSKLGLGIFDHIDIFRVSGSYSHFLDLGKGFYFATSAYGYFSTPRFQPYANFRGLGYRGLWLRGYELDVIEGQSFVMNQNTIRKRIFDREFDFSRIIPIDQFNVIPLSIYLKGYIDQGYVSNTIPYEQSDRLSNRYLMGYGLGIDFVTFYDSVFRVEYSWKIDGTNGPYYSFRTAF
ncbi:POTRA domain-containing protein [Tunicatimonas pelagia]|uniref:POTRA domain-containing protein n=1 Tax=Tunicatimonas pelagia TaxID=931531 RepID=UPI002665C72B|nr:POTRA domain-containing protein [Tunicatimonas pelagia]WKN40481.1 POTRA domain-containing protein [Tunicatimonas pelagia]